MFLCPIPMFLWPIPWSRWHIPAIPVAQGYSCCTSRYSHALSQCSVAHPNTSEAYGGSSGHPNLPVSPPTILRCVPGLHPSILVPDPNFPGAQGCSCAPSQYCQELAVCHFNIPVLHPNIPRPYPNTPMPHPTIPRNGAIPGTPLMALSPFLSPQWGPPWPLPPWR